MSGKEKAPGSTAEVSLHQAYLELAQDWSLWESPLAGAVSAIVESVSHSLNVQRVGLWLLSDDDTSLELLDLFERDSGAHNSGVRLACTNYPSYFSALRTGRVIAARDARGDPRTREFSETYLAANGIDALLDATLRKAGKFAGVLCVEHVGGQRLWNEQEKRYIVSVADLLMQRLIYEDTRRSEIYYRELSRLQQAVFDSATYSIITTDVQGTVVSLNRAAVRLLGYAPHELVGRHRLDRLHEPQEIRRRAAALAERHGLACETAMEVLTACARRGIVEEHEWTYVRKDGGRFPVLLSLTALRGDDGAISGFVAIASDISEQRKARRALLEEEARYRALFERSGDGTFLVRQDRFIDCNKATLQMFGCTREQILQQTPYRYSPALQPDGRCSREKAKEKINAALGGETQLFEWRHQRHDGTLFDAEVMLSLIEIQSEPHLLATVRDVSNRKQAELELDRSRQELMDRNESLRLINELSTRLHACTAPAATVEETMNTLMNMSRKPQVAIYLVDEEKKQLRLAGCRGFRPATRIAGETLSLTESLNGRALAKGCLVVSPDLANDTRVSAGLKTRLIEEGFRSAILLPLVYNGKALGCVNLVYLERCAFSEMEVETLEAIGKAVSVSLANTQHMAEMEYLAHHDTLTGLPNRAILHREFARRGIQGGDAVAALMLLDLDRFKEVNDTLGHYVGDTLLRNIGPRLAPVLAVHNSLLCRLGGDEFTVLVGGVLSRAQLAGLAQALLDALREPFPIDNMMLELDASIGIAIFPAHGDDSHALLRSADVAMYEAKRKGGGLAFYDREQDQHSPQRLAIMSELGTAVRQRQLCLHYQPKVDLASGRIAGFEALVRWRHPQQGLLYPDAFIPIAELSDVIHQVSHQVLDLALEQQKQWCDQGCEFSVAVNLSARNLIDDRCYHLVLELLQEHRVAADMLELEITETALMLDPEGAVKLLRRIADLGVKIAIDDFGTGYSSLAYLRRLPIDALKIDRVFVRDMLASGQDAIIVRSIIALAHNLNLRVVAEGVEDAAALQSLREMHCDLAQGYYIGRPAPCDAVTRWLQDPDGWAAC